MLWVSFINCLNEVSEKTHVGPALINLVAVGNDYAVFCPQQLDFLGISCRDLPKVTLDSKRDLSEQDATTQ